MIGTANGTLVVEVIDYHDSFGNDLKGPGKRRELPFEITTR